MEFTKANILEDIDDDSTGIFGDEPLDEVEDERLNEDSGLQLNLFKDEIAEQTVKDYNTFIQTYPSTIANYINRAYSAIVKNMPATEAQKKAQVCKASDFDAIRVKDGTAQVVGWSCKIGKGLHALSLENAITNAIKSKENKYQNKEFAKIRIFDSNLQVAISKDIVDKVNKAMRINKKETK